MKHPRPNRRIKNSAPIPLVAQLIDVIDRSGLAMDDIGVKSGVHYRTMANWRAGTYGVQLVTFQAVAESLGYEIVLRKKEPRK